MSKRNFRYLLFVYGAVIIAGAFVDYFTTVNVIPADIGERAEQTHLLFMHGVPFTVQLAIAAVMAVAVLTIIGGWAGMLLLRNWGRYLFAFGVTLTILVTLSGKWRVATSLYAIFTEIELLLAGIIISLAFWGPAKPLFALSVLKTRGTVSQRLDD